MKVLTYDSLQFSTSWMAFKRDTFRRAHSSERVLLFSCVTRLSVTFNEHRNLFTISGVSKVSWKYLWIRERIKWSNRRTYSCFSIRTRFTVHSDVFSDSRPKTRIILLQISWNLANVHEGSQSWTNTTTNEENRMWKNDSFKLLIANLFTIILCICPNLQLRC